MFLGGKIRKLRKERKLSLRKLAEISNIPSFGHIASIERGIVKDPSFKTIIKISRSLNISLDELIEDVDI